MKCNDCGAAENDDGTRTHETHCIFYLSPDAYEAARGTVPELPKVGRLLTQDESDAANIRVKNPEDEQPEPASMRLMQFSGHVELSADGEPLRVTVLVNGANYSHVGSRAVIELDEETSIGDAVDLALARAGRVVLSVDVR